MLSRKWQLEGLFCICKFCISRGIGTNLADSEIESFAITINDFQPLVILAKVSILDVCRVPGYAPKQIQKNYIYTA